MTSLALAALFAGGAQAQSPKTDAELARAMSGAAPQSVLDALTVYYALHASELEVQHMDERRTGSMFAIMNAREAGSNPDVMAELENQAMAVAAERDGVIGENQQLRAKLKAMTGIPFADALAVAPEAPETFPDAPAGTPPALSAERDAAWAALQTAKAAWGEERLNLLDAQDRYDADRTVPIGDFMRAMTAAEVALARAAGQVRLIEAKIAIAAGGDLAATLDGL
ncbi:MAG: hypothetical protein HQL35_02335 [Alphaproteobacteria bacterium]|nr:hypothetical protein [Alphaproteobacteria bacterium]